jgi:hypothetical protein
MDVHFSSRTKIGIEIHPGFFYGNGQNGNEWNLLLDEKELWKQ